MIGNINIITVCIFIVFISYVCLTAQVNEHFATPSISIMGVNADFGEGLSNIKDKTQANIGEYSMFAILEMISHVIVAVCKWMSSPKRWQKPTNVTDEVWKQQVWKETLSEFGIYEEAVPDFLTQNEPLLRTYKGTVENFMKSILTEPNSPASQVIKNITSGFTKYYVTYKKFPIDKKTYTASQDVVENWDEKFSMDMSKYGTTVNSIQTKTDIASVPFIAPKFENALARPTTSTTLEKVTNTLTSTAPTTVQKVTDTTQQTTTQLSSNDTAAITNSMPKWVLIALALLVVFIIGISIIAYVLNNRSKNMYV